MEQSSSAEFETIIQRLVEQRRLMQVLEAENRELREQGRLMQALEAENRELRGQIDELQHGFGISVIVHGNAFQLTNDTQRGRPVPSATLPEKQEVPKRERPAPSATLPEKQEIPTQRNEKREKPPSRSPLADSFVL